MNQHLHTTGGYAYAVGAASPPRLSAEATLVAKAGWLSGQGWPSYNSILSGAGEASG